MRDHEDSLPDLEHASEPLGVSLTELLVRQTLTDLENRMTAGHHLKDADKEPEGAADEDRRVS